MANGFYGGFRSSPQYATSTDWNDLKQEIASMQGTISMLEIRVSTLEDLVEGYKKLEEKLKFIDWIENGWRPSGT